MAVSLVKKIQAVTEMECTTSDLSSPCPLLSLIIQHGSDKPGETVSNKPLFVSLPDQNHCYFLTENPSLEGILVTSIPFTHPSHVSQILLYLRQQALFNSLLTSCIRHTSKPADFEDLTMFEITPLSVQHLSISFEHPVEESLATAELDLTDIGALQCNVFAASTADSSPTIVETSEFASKVLQRCFSIPITMRSLIKSWQNASSKNSLNNMSLLNGGGSLSLGGLGDISMGEPGLGGPQGGSGEGGFQGNGGSNGGGEFDPDRKMKMEPTDDVMELPIKPKQEPLFDGNIVSIDFPTYSPLHSDSFPATDSPFSSYVSNNQQVPGKSSQDEEDKKKKRKASQDPLWPKKKEDDLMVLESSSNESEDIRESLGMEFSSMGDKTGDFELDEDVMEVNDLDDVEEFLKLSAKKIKKSKDTTVEKSLQPAVNISPLPSPSGSFNISGVNLDRRPGIEIIPIASADTLGRPLTETEQLRNERKIKSKSLEEKARLEKKRKRKRDDSPMGPPDKPMKVDSSSKPSSSSSKSSDPNIARKYPSSPVPFSSSAKSSPSGNNNNSKLLPKPPGSMYSSSSSSPKNNVLSSSPKHHSSVSPKQTSSGKPSMSALKSAVTSPTSSSSSKSSSSDSSKSKSSSSSSSSSSKDFQSGREKDKKLSSSSSGNSSHSSPKLKPPTVKMKDTIDSNAIEFDPNKGGDPQLKKKGSLSAVIDKLKSAQHGGDPGGGGDSSQMKSSSVSKTGESKLPSSSSSNKIPGEYQVKHSSDGMKITINKTKTLTKVAKPSSSSPKFTGLKPGVISGPASKKSSTLSSSSKPPSLPGSSSGSSLGSTNTFSSTSSSKVSSSSSSGSSIPGSSSTSSSKLSSSSSSKSSSPSLSSSTKSNFKTNSSSSSSSSSSLSKSSSSSDPNKQRDKMKVSSSKSGSSSPSLSSSDKSKDYKSSIQLSSQHVVEGLVKQLDTKFQIPKLSARSSDSNPPSSSLSASVSSSSESVKKSSDSKPSSDTKSVDTLPSKTPDTKYPIVIANPLKTEEKIIDSRERDSVKSSSRSLTSSPVHCSSPTKFSSKSCDATSYEEKLNPSGSDVFRSLKMDLPISSISFSDAEIKKPLPLVNSKPAPADKPKGTTSQEAAELLLDFSSATQATKPPDPGPGKVTKPPDTGPPGKVPPSQVSLHIVKSPVPSPNPKLVNSPSPACIDDEIGGDDNLVGIGK
ncbi:hypothetical protein WDU94_014821 [Cyamophila willieti]